MPGGMPRMLCPVCIQTGRIIRVFQDVQLSSGNVVTLTHYIVQQPAPATLPLECPKCGNSGRTPFAA